MGYDRLAPIRKLKEWLMRKWILAIGVFAGMGLALMILTRPSEPDEYQPGDFHPGITLENARRLRFGVKLEQIEQLMGAPGTKGYYVESPQIPVTWKGDGFEVCV